MNERYEEFHNQVNKLLKLLVKMLKQHHPEGVEVLPPLDGKQVNLNVCFLTVLPGEFENLEQLEEHLEEALGKHSAHADAEGQTSFELTSSDLEFLKRNGITF